MGFKRLCFAFAAVATAIFAPSEAHADGQGPIRPLTINAGDDIQILSEGQHLNFSALGNDTVSPESYGCRLGISIIDLHDGIRNPVAVAQGGSATVENDIARVTISRDGGVSVTGISEGTLRVSYRVIFECNTQVVNQATGASTRQVLPHPARASDRAVIEIQVRDVPEPVTNLIPQADDEEVILAPRGNARVDLAEGDTPGNGASTYSIGTVNPSITVRTDTNTGYEIATLPDGTTVSIDPATGLATVIAGGVPGTHTLPIVVSDQDGDEGDSTLTIVTEAPQVVAAPRPPEPPPVVSETPAEDQLKGYSTPTAQLLGFSIHDPDTDGWVGATVSQDFGPTLFGVEGGLKITTFGTDDRNVLSAFGGYTWDHNDDPNNFGPFSMTNTTLFGRSGATFTFDTGYLAPKLAANGGSDLQGLTAALALSRDGENVDYTLQAGLFSGLGLRFEPERNAFGASDFRLDGTDVVRGSPALTGHFNFFDNNGDQRGEFQFALGTTLGDPAASSWGNTAGYFAAQENIGVEFICSDLNGGHSFLTVDDNLRALCALPRDPGLVAITRDAIIQRDNPGQYLDVNQVIDLGKLAGFDFDIPERARELLALGSGSQDGAFAMAGGRLTFGNSDEPGLAGSIGAEVQTIGGASRQTYVGASGELSYGFSRTFRLEAAGRAGQYDNYAHIEQNDGLAYDGQIGISATFGNEVFGTRFFGGYYIQERPLSERVFGPLADELGGSNGLTGGVRFEGGSERLRLRLDGTYRQDSEPLGSDRDQDDVRVTAGFALRF